MKGQFFVLATIILIGLFFAGAPLLDTLISYQSEDIVLLSDNLQKEFPKALNFGLNESGNFDDLVNFSRGTKIFLQELFLDFKVLWIVAEGNFSDSTVNITGGNFLGSNVTVILNLSGSVTNLFVDDNTTNSTEYISVSPEYNITISFNSESKTMEWVRDKYNFYLFTSLGRSDDLVKDELVA